MTEMSQVLNNQLNNGSWSTRPREQPETLPDDTGRWPGVIQQSRSFDVRVWQVSVALRKVCLTERPALRAGI